MMQSAKAGGSIVTKAFISSLKIMSYIKPYKLFTASVIVCDIFIGSLAAFWFPVMQERFLDIIKAGNLGNLYQFASFAGFITLLFAANIFGCAGVAIVQATYMSKDMSRNLFCHANNLPYDYLTSNHSGKLVKVIFTAAKKSCQLATKSIFLISKNILLSAAIFLFIGIKYSWAVSLLCILIAPATYGIAKFFTKYIRDLSAKNFEKYNDLSAFFQENIQAVQTTRIYGVDEQFRNEFMKLRKDAGNSEMKKAAAGAAMDSTNHSLMSAAAFLSAFLICIAAINGRFEIGAVVAVINFVFEFQWTVKDTSFRWQKVVEGVGVCDKVFDLQDNKTESFGFINNNNEEAPAIEFENVSFSYGDRKLFENLSFTVKAGETVAVVGASGSGKSTLAKLALGLYLPEKGTISVLGANSREHLQTLRDNISYVPQTPYLFDTTIQENIAFGRYDSTDKEIEKTAKLAYVTEFADKFADKMSNRVGERGKELSDGQRQRVAIARALIKNAPVLILDEATSSLDNESEKMVQKAIEAASKQMSVIIIAHRMSTIKCANRIIVLDDGTIAEEGTHDELLSRNGIYTRLYEHQAYSN